MEEVLKLIAGHVALALETVSVLIVTYGAIEAFVRTLAPLLSAATESMSLKHVWTGFGRWLLLGLQYTLGADIVRSAISPTWEDIGSLAAIAAIRTFLSFFLERDMEEIRQSNAG